MGGVAQLEVVHDAQRMEVVVEAQAVALEAFIQRAFTCVAEGRMADVVDQGQCLGKVFVQSQLLGDAACDLGHFDGVSQAAAKVVGGAAGEDLRLARKAAKGARLHDALAVSLKCSARWPFRRGINALRKHVVRVPGDRATMQSAALRIHPSHSELSVPCATRWVGLRNRYFASLSDTGFSLASLMRAFSSLCCTFCTSSGSASAGRECAYSVIERSHCATAIFRLPVFS